MELNYGQQDIADMQRELEFYKQLIEETIILTRELIERQTAAEERNRLIEDENILNQLLIRFTRDVEREIDRIRNG